ncbi:MAG TPA: class I SAM-dependent methyltransferase [Myxococcales bacterium]|jgi:SAM-dependent methyltransferase
MSNDEQIRLWNEVNSDRWIRLRERMVRPLLPFGEAALAALDPKPGEPALDVGCGMGETTVALARRTGDALGIDISEPFLRIARSEAAHGARYLLADAQTHRFDQRFKLCFSRFGVMFFADPVAAFANLRRALDGRFAAVAWGPWQENDWATLPAQVARRYLPVADPAPGPGPFAFGQPGSFERILREAGFRSVDVRRLDLPFPADAPQLLQVGPTAAFLRTANASDELRERIGADLETAMQGRTLAATAWLATAEA